MALYVIAGILHTDALGRTGGVQLIALCRTRSRESKGIANQFNAVEVESVSVARYLHFHVATVTLQPRRIQQQTSLDCMNGI